MIVLLEYFNPFLRDANLAGKDSQLCSKFTNYAGIMPYTLRYLSCKIYAGIISLSLPPGITDNLQSNV